MEPDFDDIRIVSIEDDLTVESPENPTLFYIYLRLSQTPAPLWQHHFREKRKVARHLRWRKAWIDRKYIVVECRAEEIETHHLNDLKQDIAHANDLYRTYLRHQAFAENQKVQSHENEKGKLREMNERLKFD
jgi:hypothetical protein